MELKPEEKEVLKLLLTRPDISRYHLNTIFPDMSRSTKWSLLHRLTKKGLLEKLGSANSTHYKLTELGTKQLDTIVFNERLKNTFRKRG